MCTIPLSWVNGDVWPRPFQLEGIPDTSFTDKRRGSSFLYVNQ